MKSKLMLVLSLVVLLVVGAVVVRSVEAADGCSTGLTKVANRFIAPEGWPIKCAIANCKAVGSKSAKQDTGGLVNYWKFWYDAVAGSASGLPACKAEINTGPWLPPSCYADICAIQSNEDLAGRCCTCNGSTGAFVRSPFSTTVYLCQ